MKTCPDCVAFMVHIIGFQCLSLLVTNGCIHCTGKKPWARISRQSRSRQTGKRSISWISKRWESTKGSWKTSK